MSVLVAAVGRADVCGGLLEGLKRLQHRRHHASGLVLMDDRGHFVVRRCPGRIEELNRELLAQPACGHVGLAQLHTRAYGGEVDHGLQPQLSSGTVALIHKGVLSNHHSLRRRLQDRGYCFSTSDGTEVIAHLLHDELRSSGDALEATRAAAAELAGSYALVFMSPLAPDTLLATRRGEPLLIGIGDDERQFICSDMPSLLPWTTRFIALEDGDVARVRADDVTIVDVHGQPAARPLHQFGERVTPLDAVRRRSRAWSPAEVTETA